MGYILQAFDIKHISTYTSNVDISLLFILIASNGFAITQETQEYYVHYRHIIYPIITQDYALKKGWVVVIQH